MIAPSEFMLTTLWDTNRLNAGSGGMRMSLADFQAIEEGEPGYRYELIDGVVVVTPSPGPGHANSGDELGHLLRLYAANHPKGGCIDANLPDFDVVTGKKSSRRPDRCLWVGLGRKPNFKNDFPTIVVEFVSPGKVAYTRDYEDKRDDYLQAGCQEYWVIDRFRRTMTIYRNGIEPQVLKESDTFTTALLPGFELPIQRILAAADEFT